MKKLTALMAALAIAVCTFTACENKNKTSESTPSTQATEISTEPDTLPADSDATALCTDLLNKYLTAVNTGDIELAFKYQYDDGIIEAVTALSGYQTVQEMYDNFKGSFDGLNLTVSSIEKVQPITDYQYGFIQEVYGRFCAVQYIVDRDGGINKTTTKYLQEVYADDEKYKEYTLDFKEGYYVECTINSEGQGNSGQRIMIYRTDEDNWKIDMTVAEYIDQCEDYAIDHVTDMIAHTANDMLEQHPEIADKEFIVGSEKSLDVQVPDGFDADSLRKYILDNCAEYTEGKYYMFIKEGRAYCSAYDGGTGYIGTNPYGGQIGEKEDGTLDYVEIPLQDSKSFDKIYNNTADALKNHK